MSIKIIKAAVMTTLVSDAREGFRSLGIGSGGAMDFFAMKAANYLAGNDREAVLEIGYSSAEFLVLHDCLVCVTGKGFEVQVNDNVFPLWKPFKVSRNTILRLKKIAGGTWAYLAVHGGWKSHEWLNSSTTNLSAKAGGFQGRLLKKDDVVEMAMSQITVDETKVLPWGISMNELNEIYSPAGLIRCISSIETELLSSNSTEKFVFREFAVTSQSNRMGYRLSGEALSLNEKIELISSPVDFGTIQLLPDGNLIVLMADHQTTGGYPRIASVIKADLSKLAQVMPGEKINFRMISLREAETELFSYDKKLIDLKQSCHQRFKTHFSNDN